MSFLPLLTSATELPQRLRADGFAVIRADTVAQRAGVADTELVSLQAFWDDLPADRFLKDGGRYRRRRHGSLIVDGGKVRTAAHRAHWQPLDYNALHGGIERWFEPLAPRMAESAAFLGLVRSFAGVADELRPGVACWFVEAHPFRIDCTDGIGRPTPEGAHRDGVDLVVVVLVGRHAIRGGETRVFEASGPKGVRFTLAQPWSALLLDDERVIHESPPIQPETPGQPGWRDTLVLTYRRHGFQDPPGGTKTQQTTQISP